MNDFDTDVLIKKLDLTTFLSNYSSFLSREKNIYLSGDRNVHLKYIKELDNYNFTPPSIIPPLDEESKILKKNGAIHLEPIIGFVKTLRYLKYLKTIGFKNSLEEWVDNINIPSEIDDVDLYFDEKYELYAHIDQDLESINTQIEFVTSQVKRSLEQVISSSKASAYLVDRQIHMIDRQEALLFRGGFNKVVPSKIVGRSSSGFFYIIPYSVSVIKSKLSNLISAKEEIIYKITRQISSIFSKHSSFLEFSQRSFNRFDGYQSRVMFAKNYDLEFVSPMPSSKIKLSNFSHPAIENPVSVSLDFDKTLLIITGVNAGGKTVLLKSVLSAVFLAKILLPMNINAQASYIGSFQEIIPIIEDPQNIKENISTFAGRMLTFSKLFNMKKNLIVGVDEIELGTDSNEAASLFEAILQELIKKDNKIIVTTHHKKLASAMAKNKHTQLLAALYNEQEQKPTYRFLQGTIGKSFAFETALRYHIPKYIIDRAREGYGADYEELSGLIEKSTTLEYELLNKRQKLDEQLAKIENIKNSLSLEKEKMQLDYKMQKDKMQASLREAIGFAQEAIKETNSNAHKLLNKAHKTSVDVKEVLVNKENAQKFEKGSKIKYNGAKGHIVEIKSDFAIIQSEKFRLKVPIRELKKSNHKQQKEKVKVKITKATTSKLSLDLHGVRADEAIERLDNFLSNAAMNDLSEVVIYHGMGSGRLAFIIKEFLETHPCIIEYKDAPQNMGGYGATVAILRDI